MWAIFQNTAMCIGYFFTSILCICVITSFLYWVYKFGTILVNKVKTIFTKIKQDNYVYRVSYEYVEYYCFITAFKDWYYVIKRYPKYPLNFRFIKKYIKYLCKEDTFVNYDYCKGYGLHKYKTLKEAKSKLYEYLEQSKENAI